MREYAGLLLFVVAAILAIRALLSLSLRLRDHLTGLLVEHFRSAKAEDRKRMHIQALRLKIRERKASEGNLDTSKPEADATDSKAA
jgi:hypothetical protein